MSVQVRRRVRDVHNLTSVLSSRIHFHKEIQSLKCVLFLLDEDTFNPAISEISGANVPVFDLQKPKHFGSESSLKVFSTLHYLTSVISGSLVAGFIGQVSISRFGGARVPPVQVPLAPPIVTLGSTGFSGSHFVFSLSISVQFPPKYFRHINSQSSKPPLKYE